MEDNRGYFEYKYGERVYMPEGIECIRGGSYEDFYDGDEDNPLFRVHIPKHVKRIEYRAFFGAHYLVTVTFEEGSFLDKIESMAFSSCERLEKFEFTKLKYLHTIDIEAFSGAGLKNIDLSKCTCLRVVGDEAFSYNKNLVSVSWQPVAYVVPHGCFVECTNLHSFKGDDSYNGKYLEYIGGYAFSGCYNIEEFKITGACKIGMGNYELEKFTDKI